MHVDESLHQLQRSSDKKRHRTDVLSQPNLAAFLSTMLLGGGRKLLPHVARFRPISPLLRVSAPSMRLTQPSLRLACAPVRRLPRLGGLRFCSGPAKATTKAATTTSKAGGSVLTRLNKLTEKHPFGISVLIATVKTSIADLIVQTMVERKSWDEIDWKRNMLFMTFGCLYLGVAMYGCYVIVYGRIFTGMTNFTKLSFRAKLKDTRGVKMLMGQVFLDILVINPVIYFPTFYAFKSLCFAKPEDTRSYTEILKETFTMQYPASFMEDNFGMGFFWIPANFIIFSVPLHLRMPITHTVSFFWCCILSAFRGDADSTAAEIGMKDKCAIKCEAQA